MDKSKHLNGKIIHKWVNFDCAAMFDPKRVFQSPEVLSGVDWCCQISSQSPELQGGSYRVSVVSIKFIMSSQCGAPQL